ncbi:MAG: hypothetical protein KME52_11930 [Desmonostoc geniculatum HA4340-LM1]|jgi:hypothetical protein|nr:hypothetical protein [Desmonostoc geniculatum HA4340-LM1]
MTPRELKEKWNLSYTKLALFLCRDQRTVERYCSVSESGSEIPEMVIGYCWFLNQWFSTNGVTPPPFIFAPTF